MEGFLNIFMQVEKFPFDFTNKITNGNIKNINI